MEKGTLRKFPCIFGDMIRDGGDSGDNCSDIQQSRRPRGYIGRLLCPRLGVQILLNI
jgi:hypothetical protein